MGIMDGLLAVAVPETVSVHIVPATASVFFSLDVLWFWLLAVVEVPATRVRPGSQRCWCRQLQRQLQYLPSWADLSWPCVRRSRTFALVAESVFFRLIFLFLLYSFQ